MLGLNLAYQFWLHTETIPRLGFLENWLNTPSNHRVHHSIEDEYIDKNYGGVLIVFDRLFGSFASEDTSKKMRYGLLGKAASLNPVKLFFQEWLAIFKDLSQAGDIRSALVACFGRPGAFEKRHHEPEQYFEPSSVAIGEKKMITFYAFSFATLDS